MVADDALADKRRGRLNQRESFKSPDLHDGPSKKFRPDVDGCPWSTVGVRRLFEKMRPFFPLFLLIGCRKFPFISGLKFAFFFKLSR